MIIHSEYYQEIANKLVGYSCALEKNENVLIEAIDIPVEFTKILIDKVQKVGARPFLNLKSDKLARAIALNADREYFRMQADYELHMLKKMNAFIGIKNVLNSFELSDISESQLSLFRQEYLRPVHFNYRNEYLKWVYLRWPSEAMAQRAKMSTDQFAHYFFKACLFDFSGISDELNYLKDIFKKTRLVRITGKDDTDISFRIDGLNTYVSTGKINLPDGEIFTAPVRDSVNGKIRFNLASTYNGKEFRNIELRITEGKIIQADCEGDTITLNSILDTDDGSRYFGEFALGLNPLIKKPINEILFDEKMQTSIHMAIGNAYGLADNGNKSAIHWDLILDQSLEMGGGDVYFDETMIKHNGEFCLPALKKLNILNT